MKDLFKDKEYCIQELNKVRELMSTKSLYLEEGTEGLKKALAMMYLYCPDDLKISVEATLNELLIREYYMLFYKGGIK